MLRIIFDEEEFNCFSIHGQAPLHIAIEKGHLEVVKYLIEKGANVNAEDTI